MERFVSILIEHFGGDFPLWLAPLQVKSIAISDDFNGYAEECSQKLRQMGVRVESDLRSEKVGSKIREAENRKIPYMLIVGEREQQDGTVSVRRHKHGDIGTFDADEFFERIKKEITNRELPPDSLKD
jgi:threonyl-tRNA synthetase